MWCRVLACTKSTMPVRYKYIMTTLLLIQDWKLRKRMDFTVRNKNFQPQWDKHQFTAGMVIVPALTQRCIIDFYMYSTVLMERDIRLNLPHQKFPRYLRTRHFSLLCSYSFPSSRNSEGQKTLRASTYWKAAALRAMGSNWITYRSRSRPQLKASLSSCCAG